MKRTVVALTFAAFLALANFAYGHDTGTMGESSEMDPGRGRGFGMCQGVMGMEMEHPFWKHIMGLGLNEEQKETVKDIFRKKMKETIKLRADMQIAWIDLRSLIDKDTVNMKEIESKLKQIASFETDIGLSHIKALQEIKSKLTAEQGKKLKEILEKGFMMRRMGMMQGRGCGMTGGMMGEGMTGPGTMGAGPSNEEQSEEKPPMEHGH